MANINFPATPALDDTYLADNGVNYQWDGEKWKLFVDATTSQVSLWARNATNTDIYPSYAGDDINARDGGGTINASLNADGSIDFITLNIDGLPTLP
jgi:hypothetical protein